MREILNPFLHSLPKHPSLNLLQSSNNLYNLLPHIRKRKGNRASQLLYIYYYTYILVEKVEVAGLFVDGRARGGSATRGGVVRWVSRGRNWKWMKDGKEYRPRRLDETNGNSKWRAPLPRIVHCREGRQGMIKKKKKP